MTQTLPQITERIPLTPDFPGTVYSAWSPRSDSQSPDINPPTDEFVSLASFFVHEADELDPVPDTVWAEAARLRAADAETQPVIDLAAVMPQPSKVPPPRRRPLFYRRRHEMVEPPRDLLVPLLALGVAGGLLMIAVQVALLQVAIRVSGAVL